MDNKYIETKLVALYPKRVINDGFERCPGLAAIVRKIARENKKAVREYLESIRFKYMPKPRHGETVDVASKILKDELIKTYPDKVVTGLSKWHNYNELLELARHLDIQPINLLKEWGLICKCSEKYEFDHEAAERLMGEFGVRPVQLACWLGIKKQTLNNRRKSRRPINGRWISGILNQTERELIHLMIESHTTTYEDDDTVIAIRNNGKVCCIFIRNPFAIKCYFELPNELEQVLKSNNFHCFGEDDFFVYNNIKVESSMGMQLAKPANEKAKKAFYRRRRELGLSSDEYFIFLGFDGFLDTHKLSDTQIKETLTKYLTSDNLVYLPVDSDDYYRLANKAHRSGYTLDKLIAYFGFERAERDFDTEAIAKQIEYGEELKKYVVSENKVYLPRESDLYTKIYHFALRRGISLEEVLNGLGYVRVHKLFCYCDRCEAGG